MVRSRNDTTANLNSLYCCSAIDLYWLGAGRYTGYTDSFLSFSQFCRKFPAQCSIRPGGSLCKIFRIPLCQLTDQRSVVGEHRGKLRKEEGRNERNEERRNEGKKEKKGRLYLL